MAKFDKVKTNAEKLGRTEAEKAVISELKSGKTIIIHNEKEREFVLNSLGYLTEKQLQRGRAVVTIATVVIIFGLIMFCPEIFFN